MILQSFVHQVSLIWDCEPNCSSQVSINFFAYTIGNQFVATDVLQTQSAFGASFRDYVWKKGIKDVRTQIKTAFESQIENKFQMKLFDVGLRQPSTLTIWIETMKSPPKSLRKIAGKGKGEIAEGLRAERNGPHQNRKRVHIRSERVLSQFQHLRGLVQIEIERFQKKKTKKQNS